MSNVVAFPVKQHPRSLGVRCRPSNRLPGYFEVLQFEAGEWRAKSLHSTSAGADAAAKKLIERIILVRMTDM